MSVGLGLGLVFSAFV